jgi:hypothetical protein
MEITDLSSREPHVQRACLGFPVQILLHHFRLPRTAHVNRSEERKETLLLSYQFR